MKVAIRPEDAKTWFGALPPDLSVIARARPPAKGPARTGSTPTCAATIATRPGPPAGTTAVFPNVGMPHVLWDLQGSRGADDRGREGGQGREGAPSPASRRPSSLRPAGQPLREDREDRRRASARGLARSTLGPAQGGKLSQAQYDEKVADLVGYITYMSDPVGQDARAVGVWVLMFLGILTLFAWNLNREFWKDVK